MKSRFPVDQRSVVGIGEMKVSSMTGDCLVTFALGSCLGITIHDPVAGVGGMVHAMLPESSFDEAHGIRHPAKFVDSGFEALLQRCIRRGAVRERLVVKVAGGAAGLEDQALDVFKIGARNFEVLKKTVAANRLRLSSFDVGGSTPRTMALDISSGKVFILVNGTQRSL